MLEAGSSRSVSPGVSPRPAHSVVFSLARLRVEPDTTGPRPQSQNQSKLSIFLMSVFRQTGLLISLGNICSIKFSNPDKTTHALSDERRGNQRACPLSPRLLSAELVLIFLIYHQLIFVFPKVAGERVEQMLYLSVILDRSCQIVCRWNI